jgi:hypothetical protein
MDFLNTAEKRDRRLVHLPMGRFGEAVELAKAALFRTFSYHLVTFVNNSNPVASDESSYMTVWLTLCLRSFSDRRDQGTDFKVDGGLTAAYVTPIGEPALTPPQSLV